MRLITLTAAIAILLASHTHAADPIGRPNAALVYWQAIAAMPSDESLTDVERKALENFQSTTIDASSNAVVAKFKNSLWLMRVAAGKDYCDWGVQPSLDQHGPSAIIPHLMKSRHLARAALLDARAAIDRGEFAQGIEDIFATFRLARHLNAGQPMTIEWFTSLAIERYANEVLALVVPAIKDRTTLGGLQRRFDELSPLPKFTEVIQNEKRIASKWIRDRGMAGAETYITDLDEADDAKKEQIRAFLGLRAENVPKLSQAIEQHFDLVAGWATKSPADAAEAEKKFRETLNDEMAKTEPRVLVVVPRLLMPTTKMCYAERSSLVTREMARAGLAIVLDGQDKLKEFKDPSGAGPFEFRAFSGGFELISAFTRKDGTGVSLQFGRAQ